MEMALAICVVGVVLIAQCLHALWRGQRISMKARPISAAAAGRVVLSGFVEPAWALVEAPFSKRKCVWYEATVRFLRKGNSPTRRAFRERNAVPFVLNDGTGRILVLGRCGRWARGGGSPDDTGPLGPGAVARATTARMAITEPLRTDLEEPPPCLEHWQSSDYATSTYLRELVEDTVELSQWITVVGSVIPVPETPGNDRHRLGSVWSLGLANQPVVGPGRFTSLSILAGAPRDAVTLGRARLLLGAVGVGLILVSTSMVGRTILRL